MTPKEKAVELYEKYYYSIPSSIDDDFFDSISTKCALIAVNELIEAFINLSKEESGTTLIDYGQGYWQEVKTEIENL